MKISKNLIRRITAVLCFLGALAMIIYINALKEIIELVSLSFILAYALKPVHKFFVSKKINSSLAAVVIITGFIAVFLMSIILVVPNIIDEGNNIINLVEGLGSYMKKFQVDLNILKDLEIADNVMNKFGELFEEFFNGFIEQGMMWIKSFKENLVKVVGIPIIAFFFLSEGDRIGNKILILFSYKRRRIISNILRDIDRVMTKYVLSEIILCIIIASSTYLILKVYGVEFPFLLSIINGILNIIPYFGPPVGGVLIVLVAAIKESSVLFYIIIWMIISQIIESNIISPMIIGESVNIHPVMIIILLIFGGEMGGFLGMVLAIPLGVIIKVLYIDINHFLFSK